MANDKNLYRDIRLGRIVNLNGRVIGSIVKKKEKKRGKRVTEMARKEAREGGDEIGNGKRTKWERRRKFEGGWVVSIIFYPKTAPSLRRAILLICKGASEKWGGEK